MDGKIVIGTEIDTKGFDKEIAVLEDKLNEIKADLYMADQDKTLFSTREIKNMEAEAQKLGRRIDALKEKQSKVNNTGFINMKQSVENVGKSVEKITKKIGKWAIAIFGVRSAYNLIRSSMSIIASQDQQLAADIEYIKNALAYTLEPIVRAIVDLAKQLLFYVGKIVYAWTGKNIFENANKSLKSANTQATKLSKTLAGFDEMNILQDTSSSGGGGSTVTPSFDLSAIENFPVPDWLQWILDHKEEVIAGLAGIAGGLAALKLGLSGIQALGIGLTITGVVLQYDAIKGFLEEGATWENVFKAMGGAALIGVGTYMVTKNVVLALVITDVFLVIDAVTAIKNVWDDIKDDVEENGGFFENWIKGVDVAMEDGRRILEKFSTWVEDKFGFLGKIIVGIFDSTFDSVENSFKMLTKGLIPIVEGIIQIFQGDLWGGLERIGKGLVNLLIGFINKAIDGINKITSPIRALIVAIGQVFGQKFTMQNIKIPRIPYLAKGGIVNMPSRGVPVGNALAGEHGAEGVIPLTDSQQMMLLGEAIGKYITINANITNTMNGRIISRELQKINSENDFAYNR